MSAICPSDVHFPDAITSWNSLGLFCRGSIRHVLKTPILSQFRPIVGVSLYWANTDWACLCATFDNYQMLMIFSPQVFRATRGFLRVTCE